ncbi:putative pectinesterase/pectinesterase inhibitor 28 [Andrographis paniculata]|uniref:putative pectinesterase/pectinesterase inhibitor 28 n=1 Tax=Andrographis paniculata TaxID=175694 RepID=UPI0021E97F9B|nr:putative pectinesterase/pectinesterase inhibitor 28 [Andrographis paniculata]
MEKKLVIVIVCSVMLVAMIVALVALNLAGGEEEEPPDVAASRKAIITICDTTDYKETCVESLRSAGTNSTDPRELIQFIFRAAIDYVRKVAGNSSVIRRLESDPRGKSALETCEELANHAAGDLDRALAKFNSFDVTKVDDILLDLKIWISAAVTNQETCLDGFDDVPGDSGRRMREAMTTSMEMSSNALAMVEELSTYLESLYIGLGFQSYRQRRLLSLGNPAAGGFPDWVDFNGRKLLTSPPQHIKPNLVVAKDGSGKYATINEALKDIPKDKNEIFILYVKEGVYDETIKIGSSLRHLMLVGDGPTRTKITGKLNYVDGVNTYNTATFAIHGDGFFARDIGFENSAGPEKHQAVALRVSADKAVFHNCRVDGYQDTLYAHTYRQFYRDCVVSGTIDFVFGDSAVVFQGCTMLIRKPLPNQQCVVTAQGRKDVRQPTGLVLQNCTIKGDDEYNTVKGTTESFLGRPWKQYSRTIIMESFVDYPIRPEGWAPWNGEFATDTLFYTEFNNRGPGAPKMGRIKWHGIKELPPDRIERFTAAEFLDANRWMPPTKVPYAPGFIFPVPKEDPNVKYSPVAPEETKDLGSVVEAEAIASLSPSPKSAPPETVPIASPTMSSPASSPAGTATSAPSPAGTINFPTISPVNPVSALPPAGAVNIPTISPVNPVSALPPAGAVNIPTISPVNPVSALPPAGAVNLPTISPVNPVSALPPAGAVNLPTISPVNPASAPPPATVQIDSPAMSPVNPAAVTIVSPNTISPTATPASAPEVGSPVPASSGVPAMSPSGSPASDLPDNKISPESDSASKFESFVRESLFGVSSPMPYG